MPTSAALRQTSSGVAGTFCVTYKMKPTAGCGRLEDAAHFAALSYVAQTRLQSDQLTTTYSTDAELDIRDNNRHLWCFHEASDDEEQFDNHRPQAAAQDLLAVPPRHDPEWAYASQSLRPDWVSPYERLHLAKRLKHLLGLLKPQSRVRLRYQEKGSELDLDVAV